MNTNKLKINLYGESWTLKKFECSPNDLNLCQEIANKMKLTITEALLSPFFYYNLKLPNISSLEYQPGKKISGLINTPSNQIEVLYNGVRLKKLKISDFKQDDMLFPLYNVEKIQINDNYKQGIYIEQKAFGLIGSYELAIDTFDIEKLNFRLLELSDKILLQKLKFEDIELKLKAKDTLIRYQNCFEIV